MSHDLYNKHTAMRRSCGMDTVNGIGRNVNCTLETKGHICAINVIIDGLRKMNNIQPLLTKKIGCLLRTITSQDNQTIKAKLIIRLLHSLNFIQSIFIRNTHHLEWLSGSTQNSTSLSQYAGKIFRCKHTVLSIDQSLISIIKSINFQFIHTIGQSLNNASHSCI